MSATLNDTGEVETHCDGDACGALGGRDASEENARALAFENGFHSHVTGDDESILCPRCAPGCTHCAAIQDAPMEPGAAMPWEVTVNCHHCNHEVILSNTHVWAFNVLCVWCFNHCRKVA